MMSHRLVVALLFALINPVIIMPLQVMPLKDHLGKNRVIITLFSSAREPSRLFLKMQIEKRTCAFADRNLVYMDPLQAARGV